MVRLLWSYDPESYAGTSITTGRVPILDRSSKVMILTKRDTLAPRLGEGRTWVC
jgi:hypothetical protein